MYVEYVPMTNKLDSPISGASGMKFDECNGAVLQDITDKELEYPDVLLKQAQIKKIVNYLLKKKVG